MKTYHFKESRITWLIYILILVILFNVLLKRPVGVIFIILTYALLFLYSFGTLAKELMAAEDRVIVKNYFGLKVNIPSKRILVYGGDADRAQFYIIGLTSLYLPAFFQGTIGNKDEASELLDTLEGITKKKNGVIF